MLLWQHDQREKKLLLRIIGSVCAVHVFCIFMLFMVNTTQVVQVNLAVIALAKKRPIVIVPAYKKKKYAFVGTPQGGRISPPTTSVKKEDTKQISVVKNTSGQEQQKTPKKKVTQVFKAIPKKTIKPKPEKKKAQKKPIQQKQKVLKKKEKSKISQKKPEQKSVREKPEEQKQELLLEKSLEKEAKLLTNEQQPISAQGQQPLEDEHVIQMDIQEYAAYFIQKQIGEEVTHSWHPPEGIDPRLECPVLFSIDDKGKVVEYTLVKSSGSLVFDMSIRSCLHKCSFPRNCFGKTVAMTFKPRQS